MCIIISLSIFPISSAAEFQFDSPKEAELKTSFSVTLESDSTDVSDVKISIQDSDGKTISQTYADGNWKSSYYYLKSVFPEKKEFEIQALNSGSFSICARLRPSGKSSFSEKCNPIIISGGTDSKIEDTTEEKEDTTSTEDKQQTPAEEADSSKEDSKTEESSDKDETQSSSTPAPSPSLSPQSLSANIIKSPASQASKSEKIILNPLNSPSIEEYSTKEGKTQQYLLYGFIVLCITIIILFALKRF